MDILPAPETQRGFHPAGLLSRLRRNDSASLRVLKIVTILAPAAFITLFEVIRHEVFVEGGSMMVGNLAVLAVVLIGAFFFSRVIFGIIERMQQENLRRNQELAALNSMALAVSESLNLDVILYHALDKVLQVMAAEAGEMYLRDEQTTGDG